jgi:hypothetical protein
MLNFYCRAGNGAAQAVPGRPDGCAIECRKQFASDFTDSDGESKWEPTATGVRLTARTLERPTRRTARTRSSSDSNGWYYALPL